MFVVFNQGVVSWLGDSMTDAFEIVSESGGVLLKVLLDPNHQIQPAQSSENAIPREITEIPR